MELEGVMAGHSLVKKFLQYILKMVYFILNNDLDLMKNVMFHV